MFIGKFYLRFICCVKGRVYFVVFLQMFSFFILAQFDWGITKASRIREHYICQGRAETISCNGSNRGKFCFQNWRDVLYSRHFPGFFGHENEKFTF